MVNQTSLAPSLPPSKHSGEAIASASLSQALSNRTHPKDRNIHVFPISPLFTYHLNVSMFLYRSLLLHSKLMFFMFPRQHASAPQWYSRLRQSACKSNSWAFPTSKFSTPCTPSYGTSTATCCWTWSAFIHGLG